MLYRILFIILTISLLLGCGTSVPIEMTIVRVEKESTKWGCIGEDHKTYLRSEDGKTDYMCGQWGVVGDKISGFWHANHLESSQNGFRRY